jgi:hypothetical protein
MGFLVLSHIEGIDSDIHVICAKDIVHVGLVVLYLWKRNVEVDHALPIVVVVLKYLIECLLH